MGSNFINEVFPVYRGFLILLIKVRDYLIGFLGILMSNLLQGLFDLLIGDNSSFQSTGFLYRVMAIKTSATPMASAPIINALCSP